MSEQKSEQKGELKSEGTLSGTLAANQEPTAQQPGVSHANQDFEEFRANTPEAQDPTVVGARATRDDGEQDETHDEQHDDTNE
jgi:hypothetical protein